MPSVLMHVLTKRGIWADDLYGPKKPFIRWGPDTHSNAKFFFFLGEGLMSGFYCTPPSSILRDIDTSISVHAVDAVGCCIKILPYEKPAPCNVVVLNLLFAILLSPVVNGDGAL